MPASPVIVGRADFYRRRMARLGWMFSAPALFFIAAVTLFPIGFATLLSFENVTVTVPGSGCTASRFRTTRSCTGTPSSLCARFTLGFTL